MSVRERIIENTYACYRSFGWGGKTPEEAKADTDIAHWENVERALIGALQTIETNNEHEPFLGTSSSTFS